MFEKTIKYMVNGEVKDCLVIGEPEIGITISCIETGEEVWCCHGTLSPKFAQLRNYSEALIINMFGYSPNRVNETILQQLDQWDSDEMSYEEFDNIVKNSIPIKLKKGTVPSCAFKG